jgi:sorting nexin-29
VEQAGFRPNISCVDQINALRIIIKQSLEFHSPLYLMFIDYKRAFDSINKECIWNALRERGLPNKCINLIKEGYNHFSCRVLHNNQLSEPFTTISEVRQGCLLSPLLFLVVLDGVLNETFQGKARGISLFVCNLFNDAFSVSQTI